MPPCFDNAAGKLAKRDSGRGEIDRPSVDIVYDFQIEKYQERIGI